MSDSLPLFGDGPGGDGSFVDGSFATAHRVRLDPHSWVEHVPGWCADAGTLFTDLLAEERWEQRRRWIRGQQVLEPRLTAAPRPRHRTAAAA